MGTLAGWNDAEVAALLENEEHGPVLAVFLADAPRLGDADRIILDGGVRLHARKNRDEDLVGGVALELR